MANWIRFSIAIACFALLGIYISHIIGSAVLLDAVLPPSVISKTTPEERGEIEHHLAKVTHSHPLLSGALIAIVISNGVSLLLLKRK